LSLPDAEGMIVVPRQAAQRVAGFAREIIVKDKGAKKQLYERVGLSSDKTVK
jgi:hypothetical protein